jgi:hypothetical protein
MGKEGKFAAAPFIYPYILVLLGMVITTTFFESTALTSAVVVKEPSAFSVALVELSWVVVDVTAGAGVKLPTPHPLTIKRAPSNPAEQNFFTLLANITGFLIISLSL